MKLHYAEWIVLTDAQMKRFNTESNSKLHVRVKSFSSTHFAGYEGT